MMMDQMLDSIEMRFQLQIHIWDEKERDMFFFCQIKRHMQIETNE